MPTHVTNTLPEARVGDVVRFQCVYPDGYKDGVCVPAEEQPILTGIVTGTNISGEILCDDDGEELTNERLSCGRRIGKGWYDVEVTTWEGKDMYWVFPAECSKLTRREGYKEETTYIYKRNAING
jgi:hypothetical protein